MKHEISSIKNRIKIIRMKEGLKTFKYSSEPFFPLFEEALEGKAEAAIHVVPSEPGSGKSTGIQRYLSSYKDKGFHPVGSSVLVILSRREEIKSYIKNAKLCTEDYSVLDSQPPAKRIAEYGGLLDPQSAPILFTTSQLVMARCGDTFTAFEDVFYKGAARPLRIWDEEFRIAEAACMTLDQLATCKVSARATLSALAAEIDLLEAKVRASMLGEVIDVPCFGGAIGAARKAGLLTDEQMRALMALSGRKARISQGSFKVPALVCPSHSIPADIAPLFVFDASARLTSAYKLMEDARYPVKLHPASTVSYAQANFHHMKMGVGRGSLVDAATRRKAILEAAAVINGTPGEPWIVVYNNLPHCDFIKEFADACADPGRLSFVKWGDHRASNDLRAIRKVMCVGLMRYPDPGYEQAHLAASGLFAESDADIQKMRDSELRSTMLQAFARSNMRNHELGLCGKCDVYVIDSERRLKEYLRQAFPDCTVNIWNASIPKLTKQQTAILSHITSLAPSVLKAKVSKADVYRHLGIDKSNFAKLVNDANFQKALVDAGLLMDRRGIYMPTESDEVTSVAA